MDEARGAGVADFRAFAHAEYAQLVRTMALYCGDVRLGEQIAHDAFVRARERWDQVARMDAPGAWLHRVAVNLSNSWWRRQSAERRAVGRAQSRAVIDDPPNPDDALAVRAALRRLPARQREALVLRYFLDLTVAETAQRMGLGASAVTSLTHRAVAALRVELGSAGQRTEEVTEDA
jgi:RNA polymerase sigma-70 factor (sigma-E family)